MEANRELPKCRYLEQANITKTSSILRLSDLLNHLNENFAIKFIECFTSIIDFLHEEKIELTHMKPDGFYYLENRGHFLLGQFGEAKWSILAGSLTFYRCQELLQSVHNQVNDELKGFLSRVQDLEIPIGSLRSAFENMLSNARTVEPSSRGAVHTINQAKGFLKRDELQQAETRMRECFNLLDTDEFELRAKVEFNQCALSPNGRTIHDSNLEVKLACPHFSCQSCFEEARSRTSGPLFCNGCKTSKSSRRYAESDEES